MHDTTYESNQEADSFAQTAKAAQGLGTSYNALVRKMADLDQQFRATENAAERETLGKQIKAINDQLKEFDKDRGKFGRNVGNYKSALDGIGDAFQKTAGSAGAVINPVKNVTAGFKALSATPAIAILGLLANVITKVSEGLKSSEKNTLGMKQALSAFQPIINAATNAVQKLGEWLVKVVEWAGKAARWLGIVKGDSADFMANLVKAENQLILDKREMELYEAQTQAKIAKLQADAANKTKFNAAQRKQFTDEAKRLSEELFEKQYELAQREVDLIEQRNSLTGNAAAANEKLIQAKIRLADLDKQRAERDRSIQRQENGAVSELNKQTKALHEEATAAIEDDVAAAEDAAQAYIDGVTGAKTAAESLFEEIVALDDARIAERERAAAAERAVEEANQQYFDQQAERERQRNEERIEAMFTYAGATASVLDSVADMFEANGEEDEKSAATAKALRTASAVIDTISGAVAAYMNTIKSIEFTPVAIPMAVANAATVLAAGMAQIKQINAVKVGNSGGGGASAVASPVMAAPAVPQIRTITGAREEDRLNQMASNQRVYLVYSDIERANTAARVRVQETEF
jgi:DNA repair exonuclease SbcCD ATPase subunit